MSKADWKTVTEFEDITYRKSGSVARIAFNRPNVRSAKEYLPVIREQKNRKSKKTEI